MFSTFRSLDPRLRLLRRFGFLAAGAIVALAVANGSFSGGDRVSVRTSPGDHPSEATTSSLPDLAKVPAPEGMVRIADGTGRIVGFASATAFRIETADRDGGFGRPLTLHGTKTDIRGIDVVDDGGVVVGYDIDPLGFVSLAETADLDALHARIHAFRVESDRAIAQQPELTDPSLPSTPAGR